MKTLTRFLLAASIVTAAGLSTAQIYEPGTNYPALWQPTAPYPSMVSAREDTLAAMSLMDGALPIYGDRRNVAIGLCSVAERMLDYGNRLAPPYNMTMQELQWRVPRVYEEPTVWYSDAEIAQSNATMVDARWRLWRAYKALENIPGDFNGYRWQAHEVIRMAGEEITLGLGD